MKQNRVRTFSVLAALAAAILLALLFLYDSFTAEKPCYEVVTVAMGTEVTVKTYGEDATRAVADAVLATENAISWRVPQSAVAQLNAGGVWRDADLGEILTACNTVSAATDGAFDVSVLPLNSLWQIGTENARVPTEEELTAALALVDYKNVYTDGASVSLAAGQGIDLGAVGKGLACDRVYQALENSGATGAVVSVGGSVLVYGTRNEAGTPWKIAVRDPFSESGSIGVLKLTSGVVSTSGDYEKYFAENGVRYQHILDARTGYPCESDLASATVICESGLYSDALSTACYLVGHDGAVELLERFGASGVLVDRDGKITVVGNADFTAEVGR